MNVNLAANEQFGTNANLQQEMNNAGFLQGNNYYNRVENIQARQVAKNSFKQEAVAQILRSLKNAAEAENARIYANTRNVLLSESKNHRQTVLKIAALDDIMIEERKKLVTASTDEAAEEAAGRLYNIEMLKSELDEARHQSKLPTPDQEARYTALLAGVNLNALNTGIYKRLKGNNASTTAATKIQALARGHQARKLAKTMKNRPAFNLSAPMVPVESLPVAQPVANKPSKAQQNAARLARLARFNKKTRKAKN